VDHYIINDDNYGMYLTQPSEMIRNFLVPSKNPNLHAAWVLAAVPRGVRLFGFAAEQYASRIQRVIFDRLAVKAAHPIQWFEYLKNMVSQGNVVLRTLLCTRESYMEHLRRQDVSGGIQPTSEQLNRLEELPEHLWVCEISVPHIHTANRHKLGDVVFNALVDPGNYPSDSQKVLSQSFVLAWFPSLIVFGKDLAARPWHIQGHVPIMRIGDDTEMAHW
jgi:hypothetical protein